MSTAKSLPATEKNALVLVVDDEPLNIDIIEEQLAAAGYRTISAANGALAIDILKTTPGIEVILLDRMMPVLNGIETLKRLKETGARVPPIILQSAAGQSEHIREGINHGAYYYLTKPFHEEVLLAIVEAALSEYRERRKLDGHVLATSNAMKLMESGSFTYRTIEEARMLAAVAAHAFPNPNRAAWGLLALMSNAVEHGNLAIGNGLKTDLITRQTYAKELARRLDDPVLGNRRATLSVQKTAGKTIATITDQGDGFNYQPYMTPNPSLFSPTGRGIIRAREECFDVMRYLREGRVVEVTMLEKA